MPVLLDTAGNMFLFLSLFLFLSTWMTFASCISGDNTTNNHNNYFDGSSSNGFYSSGGISETASESDSSLYPATVYSSNDNYNGRDIRYPYLQTTVPESYSDRFRNKVLLPDLDSNGHPIGCILKPGETFCEMVESYPVLDLKKEVKLSMNEFREFFGSTSMDGRKSYADDDSSEERVCSRIPKLIFPKMARNHVNQWIYVVNDIEYVQAVVAEVCEKEGKPCAYLDHNLPAGMYSRCRQNYSYKKLLAIHPTEQKTYVDTFQFPSCCACYIKAPTGFDARNRSKRRRRRRRR